jgi:AraC-like DNA-binding protein
MLSKDHLALQRVELGSYGSWTPRGRGICFLSVDKGSGVFRSKANSHELAKGDFLVFGVSNGGSISSKQSGVSFSCFQAQADHLYPLFSAEELSLLEAVSQRLEDAKLFPSDETMAKRCRQILESCPPVGELDHRCVMLRVAGHVLAAEFEDARNSRTGFIRLEDHVQTVFEGLSYTELLTLSVGEMAKRFSCSRRHLNRLFNRYFGCSVAALRMELRLMRAIFLLRNPDSKIINIADQCGFNHLGLFNVCFKKRFGCSPGRWRKSHRSGDALDESATTPVCAGNGSPGNVEILTLPGSEIDTDGQQVVGLQIGAANPALWEIVKRTVQSNPGALDLAPAAGTY